MTKAHRILVIDDNPHTLEILRVTLEAKGCLVKSARSGAEGVERFRELRPDIVLLDYNMPNMDGLEVLRNLKAISPYTPVVMMSAYGSEELVVKAMKDQVDDYIKKPLNTREIYSIIENNIRKAKEEEGAKKIMKSQLLKEPFNICELYIIGPQGTLYYNQKVSTIVKVDKDILAGMFTAIMSMFKESFKQPSERLKTFEQGDIKVLVEDGKEFCLVLIGTGDATPELRDKMALAVRVIRRNREEGNTDWKTMSFLPELPKFLGTAGGK